MDGIKVFKIAKDIGAKYLLDENDPKFPGTKIFELIRLVAEAETEECALACERLNDNATQKDCANYIRSKERNTVYRSTPPAKPAESQEQ